jgi:lysophospholipase
MDWRQTRFRVRSGLSLLVREMVPDAPDPARVLLLIHGACEHGGRYAHVAERWAARGWTSVIPDQRGHGESEGVRVDAASVEEYLDDLWQVRNQFCGASPPVVIAHSFGGLLAARLVQRGLPARGLMLTAPLFGVALPVPHWKRILGRALCLIAPRARFRTGIKIEYLTRDPAFQAKRRSDPLIQNSITARWFFAMEQALRDVHRDAPRITCPVLAIQGLADQTVDPAALRAWWSRLGSTHKELIELPEHVHEILNEPDWKTSTDRIADWMEGLVEPADFRPSKSAGNGHSKVMTRNWSES